ncbi:prephenate dehydrogenase [Intrasporangium calvum]|uniref:Prephenate dehydrogenase n=1 Tax=Intrasporangium calvum TaxID=53358 RepID=A0ABT5GC06_9MICO|nr:prephenate dehydrogenase [Intrasporangium calvum]MDC5695673.1 prephenate dehydrogenase [Intrasporangium calvum]
MSTHVRIVGTGLIGTSLGLALSAAGFRVSLDDPSPTARRLARDLGAGRLAGDLEPDDVPDVVVVAAPPDVAAAAVVDSLRRWPGAVVTDVASVKQVVLDAVLASGLDASRYVGSHPMAGRERSGAAAARRDLFDGRAWVVVPHERSSDEAVAAVRQLATVVGSAVSVMPAREHDEAVAAVSHVPQVAASVVAACLRDLPEPAVGLAGQGLRDVTRIAASDPRLWTQILAGNAEAVREVLVLVQTQLGEVVAALDSLTSGEGEGALATLSRMLEAGNLGHARIPGKHGAAPTAYAIVSVLVPDQPGSLARLLTDMGDAGINLEDMHLEHGLGQPFGVAYISVVPAAAEPLAEALTARGWQLHD